MVRKRRTEAPGASSDPREAASEHGGDAQRPPGEHGGGFPQGGAQHPRTQQTQQGGGFPQGGVQRPPGQQPHQGGGVPQGGVQRPPFQMPQQGSGLSQGGAQRAPSLQQQGGAVLQQQGVQRPPSQQKLQGGGFPHGGAQRTSGQQPQQGGGFPQGGAQCAPGQQLQQDGNNQQGGGQRAPVQQPQQVGALLQGSVHRAPGQQLQQGQQRGAQRAPVQQPYQGGALPQGSAQRAPGYQLQQGQQGGTQRAPVQQPQQGRTLLQGGAQRASGHQLHQGQEGGVQRVSVQQPQQGGALLQGGPQRASGHQLQQGQQRGAQCAPVQQPQQGGALLQGSAQRAPGHQLQQGDSSQQGSGQQMPGQQLQQGNKPPQAVVSSQPARPTQLRASSSSSVVPVQLTQQLKQLSLSQGIAPASSLALRSPARPGKGTSGYKCFVKANHFIAKLTDKDLHHYDIAITPEVTSRGVNRAVMKQLVELYKESHLGKRLPAYDGRKNFYTAGPLPFISREFEIILVDKDDGSSSARKERKFKVAIKLAARIDLYHLEMFLQGGARDVPQEALQVLDIVLREYPTSKYTPVGRSFYSPMLGTKEPLGDGLESWRGFYQSIRPTQMGLSLNIDMSSTAFIEAVDVIEFSCRLLDKDIRYRPLTDADRVKIKKALRGVKVEVTHRGKMRRRYRICGLTSQATRELRFPIDDRGTMKYVSEYFNETYGYTIEFDRLPCLQVGNPQKPNYLPMEACDIVEGQRYSKRLNEKQITNLLHATCQRPEQRQDAIFKTVCKNNYNKDKYAEEFGIKIDEQLALVEARVLPAPRLKYHETGKEKECLPRVGQWNMKDKKMFNGGSVSSWISINFSKNSLENVNRFCGELARMCNTSGMVYNLEPVLSPINARPEKVEVALKSSLHEAMTKLKGRELDLLVAILPENNGPLYGEIKRICETDLGVISQCCLSKHVFKINPQYLANVALKINVKVGGRNTVLVDALTRRIPIVSETPTIIFGADVTHPQPGEDSSPSIAAVVASQDWPEITKYAGLVCSQEHRRELITDLYKESEDPVKGRTTGGMIKELLFSFYQITKRKPERIIFYRDGVSEGQFSQVLLHEVDAIRKACVSLQQDYLPPITFVVVQKRHHTRLFANNHKDKSSVDRSGNILPGTVVDTKICHPTEFDFYLCSHAGIQGTSRPAHYHVLWDENKFTADGLQVLTNNLCYTYARCTRSVSIVPPAYYAHLAAFRARFYMDPETLDSGAAAGRGAGQRGTRAGPESGEALAVRPLPALKDNIKRVMFYC